MKYENNNCYEHYKIVINFWKIETGSSFKMKVVNMIDELNVNHKVGEILIELNDRNPIDE